MRNILWVTITLILLSGCNTLSTSELKRLKGGDGCYNCHQVGIRTDECMHLGPYDPCQTAKCIANYSFESTCDLGSGTCSALLDNNTIAVVQYARMDTGCTTNYTGLPVPWFTHYYGSSCTGITYKIRCQKTNGQCNGTLISSSNRYPGIYCAY